MATRTHRGQRTNDIWPGFVDALSTLLMVIIFLLVAFMLAQYFLNVALSGRDEALDRLTQQVNELSELLSLERQANAELRLDIAQLSAELQSSIAARDELSTKLASVAAERDDLEAKLLSVIAERDELEAELSTVIAERDALGERAETAEADAAVLRAALEEANRTIEAGRETIEMKLAELASLRQDLAALRKVRDELEAEVAGLAARLDEKDAELTAVRDRSKALEARLSEAEERTALAQKEIEDREIRLEEVRLALQQSDEELLAQRSVSARALAQVEILNQQVLALRRELARLAEALDAAEKEAEEQRVAIADLGRRLNLALASKVEELQRYRSEFFGRLRKVLGDRKDIRVVDDRFVFQSQVLFDTASAELKTEGREQMRRLADTLLEIAAEIPPDLPWVLRVDGHTDKRPISTPEFPSNWELSTARAISVVRFLIEQGVPADRLAATGFAHHQPLDPRDDEVAYHRNRRIELKLTSR